MLRGYFFLTFSVFCIHWEYSLSINFSMKKIQTYILFVLLSFLIVLNLAPLSFAGVDMSKWQGDLNTVSAGPIGGGSDSLDKLQTGGIKALHTVKVFISFLAVIFIVYAGTMMVIAMGDEKSISSQKRQLMYSLIAFLFVNIPGEIYTLFARKEASNVTQNI